MKTANKIISILTLFLIMIVSSCDMLQSTLSSEMNKELTAQTGSGSVVEKTFYYNGTKAADLLTTGDFKIDFGKKFNDLLNVEGSKVVNVTEMGQRELAYEINKFTTGYYFLFVVEASAEAEKKFNRVARINESLLRHLIVRVED